MFKAFVGIAAGVLAWTWICSGAAADKAPLAKRAAQSSQAPVGVGAKKQPSPQGEPKPTPASGTKGRTRADADSAEAVCAHSRSAWAPPPTRLSRDRATRALRHPSTLG